jgi:hypothetical protein
MTCEENCMQVDPEWATLGLLVGQLNVKGMHGLGRLHCAL